MVDTSRDKITTHCARRKLQKGHSTISQLKAEIPTVIQPWYADDAAAGGKFEAIRKQFGRLEELGPQYGYFPKPSKSVLIVSEKNLERAKSALGDLNFQITTGYHYLGGFIGEKSARDKWIEEKVEDWVIGIDALAATAKRYPQRHMQACRSHCCSKNGSSYREIM